MELLERWDVRTRQQILSQNGVSRVLLCFAPRVFALDKWSISEVGWIFSRMPLLSFTGLEHTFRDKGMHRKAGLTFEETTPNNIRALASLPTNTSLALGMASMSRNGYIRQQATERLHEQSDFFATAFLLLRLNDYASSIRNLAGQCLEERMQSLPLRDFVNAMPLLEQSSMWIRASSSTFPKQVRDLLLGSEAHVERAIWEGTESPDRGVRMCAFGLLMERTQHTTAMEEVLAAALRDHDPLICRWAGKVAVNRKLTPEGVLRRLLPQMEESSSPGVRFIALRKHRKFEMWESIQAAAFDHRAKVRFLARQYLSRADRFIEYRQIALKTLSRESSTSKQLIGALGILSEFALQEDLSQILPFRDDPRSGVRKEAIRTLAMIPD